MDAFYQASLVNRHIRRFYWYIQTFVTTYILHMDTNVCLAEVKFLAKQHMQTSDATKINMRLYTYLTIANK